MSTFGAAGQGDYYWMDGRQLRRGQGGLNFRPCVDLWWRTVEQAGDAGLTETHARKEQCAFTMFGRATRPPATGLAVSDDRLATIQQVMVTGPGPQPTAPRRCGVQQGGGMRAEHFRQHVRTAG